MDEVDLNGLLVVLTHFLDPQLVNMLLILVSERPQKVAELASNERNDLVFLDPSGQVLFLVRVIIYVTEVRTALVLVVQRVGSLSHRCELHFRVLTIGHRESGGLALVAPLHHASLLVNLALSLTTVLRIHHFLVRIINTISLIVVHLWARCVIRIDVVVQVFAL